MLGKLKIINLYVHQILAELIQAGDKTVYLLFSLSEDTVILISIGKIYGENISKWTSSAKFWYGLLSLKKLKNVEVEQNHIKI